MSEFSMYPPTVDENDWNAVVDHAFEKHFDYIIRKKDSEFEVLAGGGSNNAGKRKSHSTDAKTELQYAFDNGMRILLKDAIYQLTPSGIATTVEGQVIVGQSRENTKIQGNFASAVLTSAYNSCYFQNFLVNNQGNVGTGIYLSGAFNRLRHLQLQSCYNVAIDIRKWQNKLFDIDFIANKISIQLNTNDANNVSIAYCNLYTTLSEAILLDIEGGDTCFVVNPNFETDNFSNQTGVKVNRVNDALCMIRPRFEGGGGANYMGTGIDFVAGGRDFILNPSFAYVTTPVNNKPATTDIIYGRPSYVTMNDGIATIPKTQTFINVAHGLDVIPVLSRIQVTPQDNLDGRSLWVSDAGSSTFRINISSVDADNDHLFGWEYRD